MRDTCRGSFRTAPDNSPPDDCWSLREGRAYLVNDPQSGLNLAHIIANLAYAELCVPMMAQYETLGILHLSKPQTPDQQRPFTASEVSLVEAVAQQIALPLANVKMREQLREQALRDSLSGLYNRRYFEEALDHEIRRAVRNQKSVGLMMVDVDHFKRLNDSHGHIAGDARLRAADVVCRYGGDEFAIILPEASLDDTIKKAEELRGAAKASGRDHVKSREWQGDMNSQESA